MFTFIVLAAQAAAVAPDAHLAVCDQGKAIYLGHLSWADEDLSRGSSFVAGVPPQPGTLAQLQGKSWWVVQADRDGPVRTLSAPTWVGVNTYEPAVSAEPCTPENRCLNIRVDLGECSDPHGTLYSSGAFVTLRDEPVSPTARIGFDEEAESLDMAVVHTQALQSTGAALAVAVEPKSDGSDRAVLLLHNDWQARVTVSRFMGPTTFSAPVSLLGQQLLVAISGAERSGWMVVTPTDHGFVHAPMWTRISHD